MKKKILIEKKFIKDKKVNIELIILKFLLKIIMLLELNMVNFKIIYIIINIIISWEILF